MLLKIEDLRVNYGNVEALHGINLEVNEGEIVTILGANGAGKSTTLNAISGLVNITGGGIFFQDKPLHKLPAHEIVKLKITRAPRAGASSPPSLCRRTSCWGPSPRSTRSASRRA
jgi:branched-chain amino acid transport system ATP-binding protein